MTRKVLVRGRDVKIKALVLKDKSAKCKVFFKNVPVKQYKNCCFIKRIYVIVIDWL